jgi:hypothetical protein
VIPRTKNSISSRERRAPSRFARMISCGSIRRAA